MLVPFTVDPMLVIREALLSQLQKDRLRQEIIQAELAKIEHAMVLRNSSRHRAAADNVEWTKPVPFTFREHSMPPWQWSVSQECYVDEIHDPKQKEGRQRSTAFKSEKPAMEDRVGECLRPCCCNGKAGQENSKLEEQKSQETSEVGALSFLFFSFILSVFYPHLLVIFRQYLLLYIQNDVKL